MIFFQDDLPPWNVYLELTNGKAYGCDFIVSATGVVPNGRLIPVRSDDEEKTSTSSSSLKLSACDAICVDDNMKTGVPDVFAAGDVCEATWTPHAKHWLQMRLWTQARQMGMYAGQCMKV